MKTAKQIGQWAKKKINRVFLCLIAVMIIAGIGGVYFYWQKMEAGRRARQEMLRQKIAEQPVQCEKIRKIDGTCYIGEKEPGVYAVMIENHSEARPQSGIADAGLVYESIVEAPITRFLAVFSADKKVEKIGPVRSARPFYVDFALEFGAPYAHVGGSDAALNRLSKDYRFDLNEFSNGAYFWRTWTRIAPHNVYTSSDLIGKAAADKGWQVENNFSPWLFKPEAAVEARGDVESVKVDFLTPAYAVEWRYDKNLNDYARLEAGVPHADSVGTVIRAKNVAVMHVQSKVIDDYGRREVKTVGSGAAEIFLDGQAFTGKWRRSNLQERTRFFNDAGEEIRFNAGTTWIEVVAEK